MSQGAVVVSSRYVRVQVEDDFLQEVLDRLNERISRQDAEINELRRRLGEKAGIGDLARIEEIAKTHYDGRLAAIEKSVTDLRARLAEELRNVGEIIDARVAEVGRALSLELQRSEAKLDHMQKSGGLGGAVDERIRAAESAIQDAQREVRQLWNVQRAVCSGVARLNNSEGRLDQGLGNAGDVLGAACRALGLEVDELREDVRRLKSDGVSPRRSEPGLSQVVTRPSMERVVVGGMAATPPARRPSTAGVSFVSKDEFETFKAGLDVSALRPVPCGPVSWREVPDVGVITAFGNVRDAVGFMEKVHPRICSALTALQARLVECVNDIGHKVDRTLVEKMFEKFQNIIGEMAGRVDELRDAVEQTASRAEINTVLREILESQEPERAQTAVGRVRCIACGRDIPQVVGATTEQQAFRRLGSPPMSQAQPGMPRIGVQYEGKDGFDGAIVESPRAMRPGRGKRPHSSREVK